MLFRVIQGRITQYNGGEFTTKRKNCKPKINFLLLSLYHEGITGW